MHVYPVIDRLRRFAMRSPVLFVSLFYIGTALGLLVQELSLRNLVPEAAFGAGGLATAALLIVVAPVWGILRSVWLLAHKQRKAESILALVLSLPLIFVIVGTFQRASAAVPLPNRSVSTDAQGRPPALPALSLAAGYLQRYAS